MKQNLIGLLIGLAILTACAPAATVTPVSVTQESTSTPTVTPTASIAPLPTIPTFTPTFDELVQPDPFPTETSDPRVEDFVKSRNFDAALLSPNGNWAAVSDLGVLHIIQTQGNDELTVKCETFAVCEFVVPIQWSSDSRLLYLASLLTGESNIPFRQYTGIARIDINTGKFEKLVLDSSSEAEYSISLSPNGNYLAFTETEEQHPILEIIETENLEKIVVEQIDSGVTTAGNILWTNESDKIVFVSLINCQSSIHSFNLATKMLSTIIQKDPSCIELLFINDHNRLALSKTTFYPFSKSYWYLDIAKKELILASPTQQ